MPEFSNYTIEHCGININAKETPSGYVGTYSRKGVAILITGSTLEDFTLNFRKSVDEYVDFCINNGKGKLDPTTFNFVKF